MRLQTMLSGIFVCTILVAHTGCSSIPSVRLPGRAKPELVDSNGDSKLIPISTVLLAAKFQIGMAVDAINERQKNSEKPILVFKEGSATLVGNVQIVGTDTGTLAAAIPFGSPVSSVDPSFSISRKATSVEKYQMQFGLNPNGRVETEAIKKRKKELEEKEVENQDRPSKELYSLIREIKSEIRRLERREYGQQLQSLGRELQRNNIEPGDELTSTLVAYFEDVQRMRALSELGPVTSPSILEATLTFTVEQTNGGGVKLSQVFKSSSFVTGTTPELGLSKMDSATYTLAVKLPFKTSEPADSRRLYTVRNYADFSIAVEEAYDKKKFERLTKGARQVSEKLNSLRSRLENSSIDINSFMNPNDSTEENLVPPTDEDEEALRKLRSEILWLNGQLGQEPESPSF